MEAGPYSVREAAGAGGRETWASYRLQLDGAVSFSLTPITEPNFCLSAPVSLEKTTYYVIYGSVQYNLPIFQSKVVFVFFNLTHLPAHMFILFG